MADLFLSYAHQDLDRARSVAEALTDEGWTVFWDRRIPPGQTFEDYIEQRINECHALIVLWSTHAAKSKWVKIEAAIGRDRDILVPVLITPASIPFGYGHLHAADLTAWNIGDSSVEYRELVSSITRLAGRPRPPVSARSSDVSWKETSSPSGSAEVEAPATVGNGPPALADTGLPATPERLRPKTIVPHSERPTHSGPGGGSDSGSGDQAPPTLAKWHTDRSQRAGLNADKTRGTAGNPWSLSGSRQVARIGIEYLFSARRRVIVTAGVAFVIGIAVLATLTNRDSETRSSAVGQSQQRTAPASDAPLQSDPSVKPGIPSGDAPSNPSRSLPSESLTSPGTPTKPDVYSGNMAVIAGIPKKAGFSGDGGPAKNALLAYPQGIVLDDEAATLYVADANNGRIRRINLTRGTIDSLTFPSQNPSNSSPGQLPRPWGLAQSRDRQFLYVSDWEDNRIRRINLTNNSIEVIAGTGEPGPFGDSGLASEVRFRTPLGLALDHEDRFLFVADNAGHRIRRIELATKSVTTIAGTGKADRKDSYGPWSGPLTGAGDIAQVPHPSQVQVDRANRFLYARAGGGLIRVNLETRFVERLTKDAYVASIPKSGKLQAVGRDADGLVLTADGRLGYMIVNGGEVLRLDLTRDTFEVVSRGAMPGQLAIDKAERTLYISSDFDDVIRQITIPMVSR